MKGIRWAISILTVVWLTACSSAEDEAGGRQSSGNHVWKAQTDALRKAQKVDRIIQDTAEQHRRALEEQVDVGATDH